MSTLILTPQKEKEIMFYMPWGCVHYVLTVNTKPPCCR